MLEEQSKVIEPCETKEKPHRLNRDQIISYLTFLEKFYEKENKDTDKLSQKRIFLINKALNSVKKYSNFKVSPFRLNKSSINKEEQKVEDKCDIVQDKINDQNDIEEIMCLIEKEFKLNGIDANDLNDNSFMSTNLKSSHTDSNPNTTNKNSGSNNVDTQSPIQDNNKEKTKKRLSKLFLKIEMQLKTYLQKENDVSKAKLISNNDNKNQIENDNNGLSKNLNVSNNNHLKLSKRPSKMPDLANSFFSNKKKVETMLSRAKKQKRKSMIEFNALNLLKEKKDKEAYYIEDSNDKNNRKKIATALLQRPQKKKMARNTEHKLISNFNCDKIEQIIENKEEYDDIVPFDKIEEKMNDDNVKTKGNILEQTPLIFDNNESSIKITSTINRNKVNLEHFNKDIKKQISFCQNDNNNIIYNDNEDFTLLDNNLFLESSDKDASDSHSEENEDSCESECDDSKKKDDNNQEDKKEEKSNKSSNDDSDYSDKKTSNFNYFYKNSIFSPLRDLPNNIGKDDNIIEKFNNLNL